MKDKQMRHFPRFSAGAFPQTSDIRQNFAEIYRAQYENAKLVYLCGAPTRRPENSVNIWNLLWLSRRLILKRLKTMREVYIFQQTQ